MLLLWLKGEPLLRHGFAVTPQGSAQIKQVPSTLSIFDWLRWRKGCALGRESGSRRFCSFSLVVEVWRVIGGGNGGDFSNELHCDQEFVFGVEQVSFYIVPS